MIKKESEWWLSCVKKKKLKIKKKIDILMKYSVK